MRNRLMRCVATIVVMGCVSWCPAQTPKPADANSPGGRTERSEPGARAGNPAPLVLPMAVRWWGQACISIETFWGFTVVIDPYTVNDKMAYPKLDLTADLVLVTHNHADHTGVDGIKGKPHVLRGLTEKGEWADWDHVLDRPPNQAEAKFLPRAEAGTPSPHAVRVKSIHVFHDAESGAKRGKDTMFLVETDGVRMLHCGDLGHVLTDEQVKEIGPIDILFIPVGGTFTIDSNDAMAVIKQLKPRRWVWPIHFKTDAVNGLPLTGLDPFIEKAKAAGMAIRKIKGNTIVAVREAEGAENAGMPGVIVADFKLVQPVPGVEEALEAMRADRKALIDAFAKLSTKQIDHKPSDGSHTIRWNFEHPTATEIGSFSQIYHALDPEMPLINLRPAQMPPDYKPRHPDWDTAEMVRSVERVAGFTERFRYLLADVPADLKIEGTRFSVQSLTKMMVGHYKNHTTKAIKKFDLPDWPKD